MRSRVRPAPRLAAGLGVAVMAIAAFLFPRPALGQEQGDGLLPPGDWTEEQAAYLLDLIERTEQALPAFSDPDNLEELGYFDFGVTAPGGYDHWINSAWIDDEHILDPEFPESLVFRHTEDGGYVLEAAMFFLPSQYDMSNIPEDLAFVPGWHVHEDLCVDDTGRFAGLVDVNGECAVGHVSDGPPMMHVWIVDNACGHRFGGIDVGGLHCDVSHGDMPPDDDNGDMPPDDNGDMPPDDDNGDMPPDDHPMPPNDQDDMPPHAPPARPVPRHPTFTG